MTQSYNFQTSKNLTLVGVFGNRQQMESALVGLGEAGYKPDVITVIKKEITPGEMPEVSVEDEQGHRANFPGFLRTVIVGAISGGLLAGGVALITKFWSLHSLGVWEAGLAGIMIGSAVGVLTVWFNKLGLVSDRPDGEEARDRLNKSPWARVSINVPDERTFEEVRAILMKNGAYGTRFYKAAVPLPVLRARF